MLFLMENLTERQSDEHKYQYLTELQENTHPAPQLLIAKEAETWWAILHFEAHRLELGDSWIFSMTPNL